MTKNTFKTVAQLAEANFIDKAHLPDLQQVTEIFSFAMTDQVAQLIDKADPNDPIARQFIPHPKELIIDTKEQADPIGDSAHSPVKGIIHRYPDRCLFMPVQVCPVYCRFCFRREKVSDAKETLTPEELNQAYDYLKSHPEIWEVILSGGDPLILKPNFIKNIIKQLNSISHIEILRIHTRIPAVDSERITDELIKILKRSNKTIYIILHVNHPRELTEKVIAACSKIIDAGIPMLSQTVLLKDINDTIEILSDLMRSLVKNRIKPYYLHQGDLAKGTSHFRTTIEKGQQLIKELHGRFSGLCQPTYVIDIPGGHGKTPIGPCYIHESPSGEKYFIEDYQENIHEYLK